MNAITTRGLTKIYPGGVEAVSDVDLDIAPGEVFGFLGPNGAGKSTTIGMLTTTIVPTAGVAHVAGFDVVTHPRRGPRRQRRRLPRAGRRPRADRAAEPHRARPSVGSRSRRHRRSHPRAQRDVRAHRAHRPYGRHLQRRRAPTSRDRACAAVEPADPVPRRADGRLGPAHPLRALGPRRRSSRSSDDDPADHALPRRGRAAVRPRRDRVRGSDRRARHARRAVGRPRPRGRRDPSRS